VFFGEVGLSGAVRPVPHAGLRLKEASKLGFSRAVAPQGPQAADAKGEKPTGMGLSAIRHIGEAIADIAALGRGAPARRVEAPGRRLTRAETS